MNRMKSSLSPAGRQLVELMQKINFGRIENLVVCGGEPVLKPLPYVVREVKFGGENSPRPETTQRDFTLKAEVLDMFNHLTKLDSDIIPRIEIRHGLPFCMTVKEVAAV